MTIERFENEVPAERSEELRRFEREFRYPLGPGRWFRIDHGEDYGRFYRALGPSVTFLSRSGGRLNAVTSVALREVGTPSGPTAAAYIGDTKIRPSVAGARALAELLRAVRNWITGHAPTAYAVAMDGGVRTPSDYTGRLGVPRLERLGRIVIRRVPCRSLLGRSTSKEPTSTAQDSPPPRSARQVASIRPKIGTSETRSLMTPRPISTTGASALLEDTRRAKRLFDDTESELRSAHLSEFEFESAEAATALLMIAAEQAIEEDMDHLFLSVPEIREADLATSLDFPDCVRAPATVYGVGFPADLDWIINPSEI